MLWRDMNCMRMWDFLFSPNLKVNLLKLGSTTIRYCAFIVSRHFSSWSSTIIKLIKSFTELYWLLCVFSNSRPFLKLWKLRTPGRSIYPHYFIPPFSWFSRKLLCYSWRYFLPCFTNKTYGLYPLRKKGGNGFYILCVCLMRKVYSVISGFVHSFE